MSKEILNKYIELIDKGYCDDCNELNCLGNFPHKDIAKNIKAILEENQELKKQLEYLRSGEYLNQLKFERNMLQDVVDDMEVAPEDKAFIDCTHRNTELLEENQRLKNQRKLAEEVFELQEAITKAQDVYDKTVLFQEYTSNLKTNIAEEIADVLNIISEFVAYYELDEDEIYEMAYKKIVRQLERIENEVKE